MPTGIEGLDEITGGGLPRNRASLVILLFFLPAVFQ